MKQLLQSEFTKNGTTFENVASPVGADQVKDIKVANGNLAYSTDGTNYTEVQGGGAELPNIESVKFSSNWYVTDKLPYPVDDIDVNNMVMLDNKLYYFDGADHYVYKDGQWQPYVRGTVFDDNLIYGKDLFVINGQQYLVFTDTNNDVGNYIYKAPYFYVVQYGSANIPSDGTKVWSRNGHYYYSDSTTQWEFDPTNNEWNTRTWGNVNDFDGDDIWTDGFEYYYSDGTVNYVLEGTNWVQKTWNYNVEGKDVWTDGKDIYYSNNGTNKKLVDGEWETYTWEYITDFIDEGYNTYNVNAYGRAILQWGNGIYAHVNRVDLTDENNPETITYFITNKSQGTFETSIDTLKVGDLNKQNNEEAFTVGNINNALEILNNGNIGGGGVLISKTITENGVYNAIDDGATGYSSVDVQVAGGGGGAVLEGNTVNYEGTEQTLRNFAFFKYATLESVDMPDLTSAGEGCFQECYNLSQVNLPNLTQIPQSCFVSCQALTEYDFTGVETVGNSAFAGCDQLATFTNLGDVETIEPYAFGGNPNFTGTLSLANTISVSGFDNTQISALNIPSATIIGENAFQNTQLQGTLNLQNVIEIGGNAFAFTQIDTLVLPSVERIGDGAFEGCDGITTINLPNLLSLGGRNFSANLTSATVPNIQELGESAFAGTGISSISIPNVISIGGNAFADCQSLTSITMTDVQNIGYGAFMNTQLGGTLSLADCVMIESEAFSGLGYTSVTLPSIVNLGANSFANNASLTTVSVGGTETEPMMVGYGAFENCSALTSFTFNTSQVPGMIEDAWQGTPIADDSITGSYGTIYIPQGTLADYTQAFNDAGLSQYVARLTQV